MAKITLLTIIIVITTLLLSQKVYAQTAYAGEDSTICGTFQMMGNEPISTNYGFWSVTSGAAVFENSTLYNSICAVSFGSNTLRWTIYDEFGIELTMDEVVVTQNLYQANAGFDQFICADSAFLEGNDPTLSGSDVQGVWSIYSGLPLIENGTLFNTCIRNLEPSGTPIVTLIWTLSKDACTTTDTVVITNNRVTSQAGIDQNLCATTAVLAASNPLPASGSWAISSGSGIFSNSTLYNTNITALSAGSSTLRWTVSNGFCSSFDEVVIYNALTAVAGIDQIVCSTSATLAASALFLGTGVWTKTVGAGTITKPTLYNSALTSLGKGANTFRWTVTEGRCVSFDDVIINNALISNAGGDISVCGMVTSLAATNPAPATGNWSLISGTGVFTNTTLCNSGITISNNFVANTFRWTVNNAGCISSDDVIVTNNTVTANAGSDQNICSSSTTMAATKPTPATGTWNILFGTGTIVSQTYNATINGLGLGTSTFRWTVSRGGCTATDDVNLTNNLVAAQAGADQNKCTNSATINAIAPGSGSGFWSVISGGATLANTTAVSTSVSNLSSGSNVFRWTVNHLSCTSVDDVNVNYIIATANAGTDQTKCSSTATLAGNNPSPGTGLWTISSGTGAVNNSTAYNSTVLLGSGINSFRWTVTNGSCSAQDYVIITNNTVSADAGADQTICVFQTTLNAVNPTLGTGQWSVQQGTGVLGNSYSLNSSVNGLSQGSNIFRWSVNYSICNAYDDIVVTNNGLIADAGLDQILCVDHSTLSATIPAQGYGYWTLHQGGGVITNSTLAVTEVTNLQEGSNTFRWIVSYNSCSGYDDAIFNYVDRIAEAGIDQELCEDYTILSANNPSPASGFWNVIEGAGSFSSVSSYNSAVTSLDPGVNKLEWTVTNVTCVTSSEVFITFNQIPLAIAGLDSVVCDENYILQGSDPQDGHGEWSVLSGSCLFVSSTTFNSAAILGAGTNQLKWKISLGNCSSSDEVSLTNNITTAAAAGIDQIITSNSALLTANSPDVGEIGFWIASPNDISIDVPSNATINATNLAFGTNTFTWTIMKGKCSSTDDAIVRVDNIVNKEQDVLVKGISVFSSGKTIHINNISDQYGIVELFDLRGQKVYWGQLKPEISTNIKTGVYFVKVHSNAEYLVKKVFVE